MPDIGDLRLLDFMMPVGQTGIMFVAGLSGVLTAHGPVFDPLAIAWAYRRAASQIAYMALIDGQTFAFMREAIPLTQAAAAALLGVDFSDLVSWEDRTVPTPPLVWLNLAKEVCVLDHRGPPTTLPFGKPDLRARTIRVFPDIPGVSQQIGPSRCPCLGRKRRRRVDPLVYFCRRRTMTYRTGRPRFANKGSALRAASKGNPRELPCPTCKEPNKLTPADVRNGYQCDDCANKLEGTGF